MVAQVLATMTSVLNHFLDTNEPKVTTKTVVKNFKNELGSKQGSTNNMITDLKKMLGHNTTYAERQGITRITANQLLETVQQWAKA